MKGMHVPAAALVLCGLIGPARADRIVLANGDRITGEIVAMDAEKVQIKGAGGGEHTIPRAGIRSIRTDRQVTVVLPDGRVVRGKIEAVQPARARVVATGAAPVEVAIADLRAINPPPPEPEKTERDRWSGKLTAGLTIKDGNSNSKTASARGNLVRRGEKTRLTFRAGWDYIEQEGDLTDRSTFGEGKADYFFTKRFFGYTSHLFEGNYAQDLHLRYTGGVGGGYQFVEDERTNLFAEAGLSYVSEDYNTNRSALFAIPPGSPVSSDDEYASARGAVHFEHKITESLVFTEDLTVFPGLEDAADLRAISESALTATITNHLGATAMIVFEYDNTPASGRGRRDTTYILGITYAF